MATISPTDWSAGTILACSGRSGLSRFIECCTCSRYSHVALIATITKWDLFRFRFHLPIPVEELESWLDGPYIVESTTLHGQPCLIMGKTFDGVQVHLPESVGHYEGRVWQLRPMVPLDAAESQRLTDAVLRLVGTEYDAPGAALAGTRLLKRWLPCVRDREKYFCVELVADALGKAIPERPLPAWEPGAMSPKQLVRRLVKSGLYHKPERVR